MSRMLREIGQQLEVLARTFDCEIEHVKEFRRHCQVNTGRRQLTDGIPVSTSPLSTRDHQ